MIDESATSHSSSRRRSARLTTIVVLGLLALLAASPGSAMADVNFQVKGKWTCSNRGAVTPIAGARMELWREISYWPDDKITSRHLGSDGSYNIGVKASKNFTLYVKLLLHDDNGVELENWYSPFTWETETSTKGTKAGTVDLGTWQISKDGGSGTPKCAIWQGAHNAYGDYRTVVGSRPPSPNYKINADFPCCGTPFTTLDNTRWPSGYATGAGYSTNFHEFAHSMRHTFDGNTTHFLGDVARYSYPQFHSSCKVTNEGFAFNEGWAEYWAKTPQTCGDGTNFTQEGNVASALTALERCTSRPSMVRVLRESRGGIHSYAQFRSRFLAIFGQKVCLIAPITAVGGAEQTLSARQLTTDIEDQITAQKKLIARLSRQTTSARKRARNPGRCAGGRCQQAMEKLIEPSALSAQVQQAKLVLGRLEDGLAAAQKAKFDPGFSKSAFVDKLDAESAKFERANQSIVIDGLSKSMREIKTEPGFKRGRSTDLFRTLDRRLDSLTRVRKRRQDTPASLETLYAPPSAPVDVVTNVKKG